MKKFILLFLFVLPLCFLSTAQECVPAAHDWQGVAFGASPETFAEGYKNQPYNEVVYIKIPTNASDINPAYNYPLDSLRLDSITINNGVSNVSLSSIGLDVVCNNNGESSNPCLFLPGGAYCGDITERQQKMVLGFVTISISVFVTTPFGSIGFPYPFSGLSLTIHGDGISITEKEEKEYSFSLGQSSPNPAASFTNIPYTLATAGEATFYLSNLLGEKVYEKTLKGKKGENTFTFDTSEIQSGIYLYSVQTRDKKLTKRMVIQH